MNFKLFKSQTNSLLTMEMNYFFPFLFQFLEPIRILR